MIVLHSMYLMCKVGRSHASFVQCQRVDKSSICGTHRTTFDDSLCGEFFVDRAV